MENIWSLSKAQLKARRGKLGGSHAGAIVAGGEEWPALFDQITGHADVDLSGELRVMMGLCTETLNRFWFEKQTGRVVERVQQTCQHPKIAFMACTLDGATTTADGKDAVWEAKHVGKHGEQFEIRYTAQCTHNCLCLGVDHYVLSAFVGNSRWECGEYEIKPLFAADYLERCRLFWSYVFIEERPPSNIPPLGVPRPRELRRIVLEDDGRASWPNWGPPMVGLIRKWVETKPTHELHMATREDIKDLLPEDVGELTRGLFTAKRFKGGVRMTLKGDRDE